MNALKRLWRTRRLAVLLGLVLAVAAGAVTYAATARPAIQTFTPHSARQITNIDVLRQQIRNYYGDPLGTGQFAPDSNYAKEASRVAADGGWTLQRAAHRAIPRRPAGDRPRRRRHHARDLELRDLQQLGVQPGDERRPTCTASCSRRCPAWCDMVSRRPREGYAIFYLTGRPAAQEAATLGNLTADGIGVDAGYPAPTTLSDGEDGLFTKPAVADYPDYLKTACAGDPNGSCTTVHYKSATRAHIESLGYDIVANFGDQYSDLQGGYADRVFKLPNPNYFLP